MDDYQDGLDPETRAYILGKAKTVGSRVPIPSSISTSAGLPSLQARKVPISDMGVIYNPPKQFAKPLTDVLFVRDPKDAETMAHEMEHLLARRGLGNKPYAMEEKFAELYKGQGGDTPTLARHDFVRAAIAATPYLQKTYGFTPDYYFSNENLKGKLDPRLFSEQIASLSALEQSKNIDLTKDPYLRETLFKDPIVRQVYNAVTGLRQTRLDPRDIPPYTVTPEKQEELTKLAKATPMPDGLKKGGRVRMI